MDRRKFLTVAGATGVAAVWGSTFGCATSGTAAGATTAGGAADRALGTSGKYPLDSVGLQLYTIRNLAEKDLDGTLAQVAAAGYKLVETHSLYGRSAAELRALLDKHGLDRKSVV